MESKSESAGQHGTHWAPQPAELRRLTTPLDNVHPEHGLTRPCTTRDLHKSYRTYRSSPVVLGHARSRSYSSTTSSPWPSSSARSSTTHCSSTTRLNALVVTTGAGVAEPRVPTPNDQRLTTPDGLGLGPPQDISPGHIDSAETGLGTFSRTDDVVSSGIARQFARYKPIRHLRPSAPSHGSGSSARGRARESPAVAAPIAVPNGDPLRAADDG